jgi:hypothetical protein
MSIGPDAHPVDFGPDKSQRNSIDLGYSFFGRRTDALVPTSRNLYCIIPLSLDGRLIYSTCSQKEQCSFEDRSQTWLYRPSVRVYSLQKTADALAYKCPFELLPMPQSLHRYLFAARFFKFERPKRQRHRL